MFKTFCRFSPDNRFLAVGAHEGTVDFYDLSKGHTLQRAGFCKGIQGFVAMMDFSVDSKHIKVCVNLPVLMLTMVS